MNGFIGVQPAASRRRAFARWAVAQHPKIGTVGPNTFAVPPHLFAAVPEGVLLGALVDGQPYVPRGRVPRATRQMKQAKQVKAAPAAKPRVQASPRLPKRPVADLSTPATATPAAAEPQDTTLPEQEAEPGQPPPPVPATAYPSGAVPLGTGRQKQEETAAEISDSAHEDEQTPPFRCEDCERVFTTEHGRNIHRRRKHAEES